MKKNNNTMHLTREQLNLIDEFIEYEKEDFMNDKDWIELTQEQKDLTLRYQMREVNPKTGDFDFEKSASWDCKIVIDDLTDKVTYVGKGVYHNRDGNWFPKEGITFKKKAKPRKKKVKKTFTLEDMELAFESGMTDDVYLQNGSPYGFEAFIEREYKN